MTTTNIPNRSIESIPLPFKKWNSPKGKGIITSLLEKRITLIKLSKEFKLLDWEFQIISRALRRFSKKRTRPVSVRIMTVNIAAELDLFRSGFPPNNDLLDKLDDPAFYGNRLHLVRLFACMKMEPAWDKWRAKSRIIPDLRGARLDELDLRFFDLSYARLQHADLSAALVRTGSLEYADLRNSVLRNTDFSYANLEGAKLNNALFNYTVLTEAGLQNADMRNAYLFGTSLNKAGLQGADLRGAKIWGISIWDINVDDKTKQENMYVYPSLDPNEQYSEKELRQMFDPIRVDDLDVAHFVAMLIENPKIGDMINAAAANIVLLLGRFRGASAKVLDVLKAKLPLFGFVPVVFDFDEPVNRDTIETVAILAGLSSFVIANLSKPRSTPLESHLIIPTMAVPFVPIIKRGEQPFSMFSALQRKYPWVLDTVIYNDEVDLTRKLKKYVIEPAKASAVAIRKLKHPSAKNQE